MSCLKHFTCLISFILSITLQGRSYYYFHFYRWKAGMKRDCKSVWGYTAHDDMMHVKAPAPGLAHKKCRSLPFVPPPISCTAADVEGPPALWVVCLCVGREAHSFFFPPPGLLRLEVSLRIFLMLSFAFIMKASAWAFDKITVTTGVQTGNRWKAQIRSLEENS